MRPEFVINQIDEYLSMQSQPKLFCCKSIPSQKTTEVKPVEPKKITKQYRCSQQGCGRPQVLQCGFCRHHLEARETKFLDNFEEVDVTYVKMDKQRAEEIVRNLMQQVQSFRAVNQTM
ncbi:Hypothetical_protein [Hexamita inflata]|uniref:Hypothetical_protein n=1 Tax=Hexamita inflata TaxID=28002 RepID=A0AA86U4T6_9EUKA|nr:Hypothetical protein HINF_LOCUS28484 [Hexamita inflata]